MTVEATETLAAPPAPELSGYGPDRPVLLLTDGPPDAGGGGAVILRSLLGPLERERVVWACLEPPADPSVAADPNVVPLRGGTAGGGGRRSMLRDHLRAGALAEEVLALARLRGARALWVVMHGAAVAVAARLARRGLLPMHLTVHDDPAFANALRSRRHLALVPAIARDLARALRGACSVDVVGAAMADRYRRLHGIDPVVVHRAVAGPVAPAPPYDRGRHGLRVGVLGSTYGYGQLPVLGRAVAGASRRLGVPGRLLIVGRGHGPRLRRDLGGRAEAEAEVEVEAVGHVPEPEAVGLLRGCYLLYLNYPFGPLDAVLRRTSFPTKLGTYVLAARPLLVHAPGDSSTAPLCRQEPSYAAHWGRPGAGDGQALLERLWGDPDRDAPSECAGAAERTRRAYFDPDRNRRALFGALDALVAPGRGS